MHMYAYICKYMYKHDIMNYYVAFAGKLARPAMLLCGMRKIGVFIAIVAERRRRRVCIAMTRWLEEGSAQFWKEQRLPKDLQWSLSSKDCTKTSLDDLCSYKSLWHRQKDHLLFADIKRSDQSFPFGVAGVACMACQFESQSPKVQSFSFHIWTLTDFLSPSPASCHWRQIIAVKSSHSTLNHGPEQFHWLATFGGVGTESVWPATLTLPKFRSSSIAGFKKANGRRLIIQKFISQGRKNIQVQGSRDIHHNSCSALSGCVACTDHDGPHIHCFKTAVCHGKIDTFFSAFQPEGTDLVLSLHQEASGSRAPRLAAGSAPWHKPGPAWQRKLMNPLSTKYGQFWYSIAKLGKIYEEVTKEHVPLCHNHQAFTIALKRSSRCWEAVIAKSTLRRWEL